MSTARGESLGGALVGPYARPVLEWAFWVALAAIYYAQTGYFDEEIPNYAFGATGWPRALALAAVLGATGQLLTRLAAIRRGEVAERAAAAQTSLGAYGYQALLFAFPFIYLFVTPTLGFYVSTPLFIVGLLLLLEVRAPITVLAVTGVVYGLVLLIFTRLFYVALPVGSASPFYDINVAIIEIARYGV